MVRMLVYVIPVALTIYGLVDLARSQPVERAGLRPLLWILIMLVPVLGPLTWLFVSRSQRSAQARERRTGTDRRTGFGPVFDRRRGPVAPDDDPDFLWRLAQQQRRAQRPPAPPTERNRRTTDHAEETVTDEDAAKRAGEDARDESES